MGESGGSGCIADISEVAALYERHAVRTRRLVALDVRAPEAVIEDACQVAWMRLVRNRGRVRRDGAERWVVRVARHEAYRSLRRDARIDPLQALEADDAAPDLLDDLVARRARLDSIRSLPDRQRRLVWLQGLGFSYAEMAGATGDSPRTVERQLLRARARLRRVA